MKKIYGLLLAVMAVIMPSCDDQLDIVPNGKTTFTNVDELESLLNQQWRIYDWYLDFNYLCNQAVPDNIEEVYNVTTSLDHAWIFCDESIDRADLTEEDARYAEIYEHIYYMNVVISKMDDMEGDQSKKTRLVAEARVLRAWFHFLLVNFYAQQYSPKTAGQLGGIAYVDNTNSGEQKTKLTVAQVYDRILDDCSDEVIACLKPVPTNDPCRFEADFGYGVRARVLFQMKRYEEAITYARKAIAVNGSINNRSSIPSTGTWDKPFDDPDVYLFINSNSLTNGGTIGLSVFSPELMSLFEEGDYLRYYTDENDWYDEDMLSTGIPGVATYRGSSYRLNSFGIDAEQMYYVAAESLILTGHIDEGLEMVDRVRVNRIHPDFYKPFKGSVTTEKDAMALLRKAKRVEFLLNYEHFFDCKRLNSMPDYAAPVIHDCGEYGTRSLNPGSPLWVYPFPINAVIYNSSLTQNY